MKVKIEIHELLHIIAYVVVHTMMQLMYLNKLLVDQIIMIGVAQILQMNQNI